MNEIPEEWTTRDIFKSRCYTGTEGTFVTPRPWAFEISTVLDNVDILLFSKIKLKVWPDATAVARRCSNFINDSLTMSAI